jgi:predicted DNA-binding transcriptional regulator YafY
MEKTLRKALNDKRPVQIIYKTDAEVFTKRTILITTIENDYIKAYCYLRNQFRTFRTENILAAFTENHSMFPPKLMSL